MKKIIYILLIQLCYNSTYSQNLVPNPSFEDTVGCPTTLADLSKTTYWTSPSWGSPDFFHACNGGNAGIPNNTFGSQLALYGSAYIGFGVYDSQDIYSYREYIQAPLTQTLSSGQKYWVCFYVSLADTCKFAIKEIGAYFSDTLINSSMDTTLSVVPQIEFSDSIITDKSGWVKVHGSFVASGTESYIVLGNFNRKQTTTSVQVNNNNSDPYAYYYIDNICVSTDSTLCSQTVGLNNINIEQLFTVFPNPFTENIFIKKSNANESYDLLICDLMGQTVFEKKGITANSNEINAANFKQSVLYVNIQTCNQSFHYKLIKP
ncbi:MAG TPA: T9SS type A sorting domain-containing protein [Bacteroidia bacterium]